MSEKLTTLSVEQLHHFQCGCEKKRWFSIGDPQAAGEQRDHVFCVWCGDRLIVEEWRKADRKARFEHIARRWSGVFDRLAKDD
jgi:hypothetical protein